MKPYHYKIKKSFIISDKGSGFNPGKTQMHLLECNHLVFGTTNDRAQKRKTKWCYLCDRASTKALPATGSRSMVVSKREFNQVMKAMSTMADEIKRLKDERATPPLHLATGE